MTVHSDRKALAKERTLKLARGGRPDDHKEQRLSM